MGILAIDLNATGILHSNPAIALLQRLGKVELDLARRPLERTFNRRLCSLKPTMSKREAGTEHPGNEREDESSRACQELHRSESRSGDT